MTESASPFLCKVHTLIIRICMKLKGLINLKGSRLAICYIWHFPPEGWHGLPTLRKLKFLIWPSSGPVQYKFILWYTLGFLWKFQPDDQLQGVVWADLTFMNPSPTTLPEPALWATCVFLKEHTMKIHFSGDSCVNQYGLQPWIYLNWEYISISLYSHLRLYFHFPRPHMTHMTPLVYHM